MKSLSTGGNGSPVPPGSSGVQRRPRLPTIPTKRQPSSSRSIRRRLPPGHPPARTSSLPVSWASGLARPGRNLPTRRDAHSQTQEQPCACRMKARALRAPAWRELAVLLAAEIRRVPLGPARPSMDVYPEEAQGIFSGQRALWARAQAPAQVVHFPALHVLRLPDGGGGVVGGLNGSIRAKGFYGGTHGVHTLGLLTDIRINDLGNSKKVGNRLTSNRRDC